MHIHRQHQPHADIQHEHRAAACRIEGQGDADDRQEAEVHADIDEYLGHERAADAGADEGAQHILAACSGGEGLDDDGQQHTQYHAAAHEACRVADPAEDEVIVGVGDAEVAAAEEAVAEDAARADGDLAPLLLVDDVLPDRLAGKAKAAAAAAARAAKAPMIYFQLSPAAKSIQQPMMP